MAIVRQKTQVFNQPIGVVRADASDDAVGRAIANSASNLANLAYREAAIEAEKAGQEAGGAPSRTDIVTIDPTTGRPVAYQPPANFGRIAARSYQNMIDRRFEESINTEIAERGAEIAADSTSAAQYRDRMSSYVQEMYSNAVDQDGQLNNYGRFIQESGTSYIASTYATMREREARAAREALIRQQNLENFMAMRQIPELITSGANPEEITARIATEEQRLLDLYNTGDISLSTFSSRLDQLDGYTSQVADNRLINIYSSIPEGDPRRPQLLAALRNPSLVGQLSESLGISDLNRIMIEAKMNGSIESLASAMTAQATYMGEAEESAIDQYVRDYQINPNAGIEAIEAYALTLPEEYQAEVKAELIGAWVAQNVNLASMDQTDIDRLTNELRTVGEYNFDDVAAIAGPQVAEAVLNMSQAERNSLAEQLSGRRAALNAISSERTSQTINSLRSNIRNEWRNQTLLQNEAQIRAQIGTADIDESTRDTLFGVLDEAIVAQNLENARRIGGLSHDRMTTIRNVVRSDESIQAAFLEDATDSERAAFEAYRDAYRINPSTADRAMGDRVTALNNITQDSARQMRLAGIDTAIQNQLGVSQEDLEFLDEQLFGDLGPINSAELLRNPVLLDYADKGYALPSFVQAIANGLRSRNEEDVAASLQLFERYSNMTGEIEGGRTQPIDLLRSELPADVYGLFSAVSIVAREERRPPLDVMLELQSLEDNPDSLIRADLGLSSNAPLRNLITQSGFRMSSNYEEEILAMMRIRRARGMVFDENTVENIINDYVDRQQGLREDSAVMGNYIGDETVYARTNYFSASEITENREQLFDLMMEDENLREVLKGGTTLDAFTAGLANSLGFNIPTGVAASLEALFPRTFGSEAAERLSDRDRLMAGLQIAGFEIKYMPIAAAFEAGNAAYQVGYEQNGAFQPILINGEPYVLAQSEDQVSPFERQRAYNNFIAAQNGGATTDQIERARFEYFRTLDHMTDEMLREQFPDLMEEQDNAD